MELPAPILEVGEPQRPTLDPQSPRRIPNLLHLLFFLALAAACFVVCELFLLALHPHNAQAAIADQRLQLFVNSATYALALAAAWLVFPFLWHRSFASGISWNPRAASLLLIPAGIALGLLTSAASTLLPVPKAAPIEKVFATPGIIWTLAVFGTFVAPLFEEIVFRGFLLPGLATLIDYLRLPKSLDALHAWQVGDTFSRPALVASTILTSLLFGGIHAAQPRLRLAERRPARRRIAPPLSRPHSD